LKIYSDYNELGATFDVLDEEMQLMFLRSNFYKLGINKLVKMSELPGVIKFFNECGENCIEPEKLAEEFSKQDSPNKDKYMEYCKVYRKYLNLIEEERKIDFPGLQKMY